MNQSSAKGFLRFGFTILVLLLSLEAMGQVALITKKQGTKVYQEPTIKSSTVATLAKDTKLQALTRKGMFWQVKDGYVKVSDVLRSAETDLAFTDVVRKAVYGKAQDQEQEPTRARSAVMGVRGLADNGSVTTAGDVKPNHRAVGLMESLVPTKAQIDEIERGVNQELEGIMKKMNQSV